MAFENRGRRNGLAYYLNSVTHDHAKVSRAEMDRNKTLVDDVVGKVIDHMLNDITFKASYVRNIGVGSSHENLKVREADEFDYNICLKITKNMECLIHGPGQFDPPGYAMFEVVSSASAAPHKWQSFMDDENYLIPSKLFDWFYGLVARALKSLNLREVTLQRAGPSANLIINKPGVREMSVDLAPTIQMLGVPPGIHFPDSWPDREKMKSIPGVMRSNSLWQLCTKEHMGAVFSGNRRWWRISTSPLEKYVLDTIDRDGGGDSSGGGCRKQILRLLKLLREVEGSNWLGIKSYHLKHLVMSESCRHVDWSVGKIDVCFVGCLRTLENSLQEQNLRNVFFPKMNMFSELSVTNNLAFRVKRIAKNIERDPNEAKKYFEN